MAVSVKERRPRGADARESLSKTVRLNETWIGLFLRVNGFVLGFVAKGLDFPYGLMANTAIE